MTTIRPISIENYPREISSNCLGFALGLCESVPEQSTKYNLDSRLSIEQSFLLKVKELGFEPPRLISSIEEVKEGEYAFMVFDFKLHKEFHPFVGWLNYWDYHVVRREPNGTWVHKPGWNEPPCKINNWEEIFQEFGNKYVLFAI